jgi:hypothetical protein
MLHNSERKDRIHIISMDRLLVDDIHGRLADYPGMETIELVKPGGGRSRIEPNDVRAMGRDTMMSRVLIIDVRSHTRPRLQPAHSEIVRFNRPDFNRYCYTVLVGDGPLNYLQSDKGLKAFPPYFADLRIDFSAAAFFGDPFLYYSMDEMHEMAVQGQDALPVKISRHFEKYFKGDRPTVAQVRSFFGAADKGGQERVKKRKERLKVLEDLCVKVIMDGFPNGRERILAALSREGLAVPGEVLRCNVYPFFFEERVMEVLKKAQAARV